MKKVNVSLAALMALTGLAQATPNATIKTDKTNNIRIENKITHEKKSVKQSKEIELDGTGGIINNYFFAGTPPKIYGEWLQRTGRQKWSK